jgi:DNA-directed RNA polymerase specialized sigma24 family protein
MKGDVDNPSISGSEWTLTEESFNRFLAHLDPDKNRAGEKYEALRLTLVKFFDWRGAHFPEECADETINRIARKIDSGEVIHDITTYGRGVARMILLEAFRRPDNWNVSFDELGEVRATGTAVEETDLQRRCLEECLSDLAAETRRLILDYYNDERRGKIDNRLSLAETLGIPLNALRSRAQRVRSKLENCVNRCVKRRS